MRIEGGPFARAVPDTRFLERARACRPGCRGSRRQESHEVVTISTAEVAASVHSETCGK